MNEQNQNRHDNGHDQYDDVLNTLYQKIDAIAERKLNESVVREVNRGLSATVQAYKRQQNRRLFFSVLWVGAMALLIVIAFGIGVRYASSDAYIEANYQKLLERSWKQEIRSAVSQYLKDNGVPQQISVASGSDTTPEIYEKVLPSVVGVRVTGRDPQRFIGDFSSKGSGVVLQETEDAFLIVTNYHVIENYIEIKVDFHNNTEAVATVLGVDSEKDIAMLSVKKEQLSAEDIASIEPITIADSNQIRVGERAIAIGNPVGYSNTITAGIVSAVDRIVENAGNVRYIQTDAAINPGNSGGALVNAAGELIGINTAKIKDVEVEGIGFAIPSSLLMQVFPQLVEKGYSTKGYIGIRGRTLTTAELEAIEVLEIISGAAAESQDIRVGDYIVAINGVTVRSMQELGAQLSDKQAGDMVKIRLIRSGETLEFDFVLGEQRVN